jgi:DNA-binding beta-propeller fold protein YncE
VVPDDGICANATWNPNGVTVAGGNGVGSELNQLRYPWGFFVDDDDAAIYVADTWNFRVVKWASGALSGRVIAGGNGQGSQANQLNYVTKLAVDKNGTIFLCDRDNRRIQRWLKDEDHGQTIISIISCWGVAMDNKETLYISDLEKHCVTKWPGNQIIAGGNGKGHELNELNEPADLFVDHDQSVFVADYANDRVMKWPVNAKEGIVIAGGNGQGDGVNQLDGECKNRDNNY